MERDRRGRPGWTEVSLRRVRRVVVAVVGTTVLLLGVAMTVLPGRAIVLIPLGLAILATELVWARWLLGRVRERTRLVTSAWTARREQGEASRRPPPPGT
jgi:hypothetical protein